LLRYSQGTTSIRISRRQGNAYIPPDSPFHVQPSSLHIPSFLSSQPPSLLSSLLSSISIPPLPASPRCSRPAPSDWYQRRSPASHSLSPTSHPLSPTDPLLLPTFPGCNRPARPYWYQSRSSASHPFFPTSPSPHLPQVQPSSTSLLVSEPLFTLPGIQRSMAELAFEHFAFRSYLPVPSPVLAYRHESSTLRDSPPPPTPSLLATSSAAAASSASAAASSAMAVEAGCGLVVDAGFSFTHAVPIWNNRLLLQAVR
ncbi:unnamed protein product, partial [Closterium sp. NIES-53]